MPSQRYDASLKQFAKNLCRLRTERGFTQEGLSELAGIHRTEMSMLERAKREPRMGTLIKLAAGLKVSLDDLLEGIAWQGAKASQLKGRFLISPVGDETNES